MAVAWSVGPIFRFVQRAAGHRPERRVGSRKPHEEKYRNYPAIPVYLGVPISTKGARAVGLTCGAPRELLFRNINARFT